MSEVSAAEAKIVAQIEPTRNGSKRVTRRVAERERERKSAQYFKFAFRFVGAMRFVLTILSFTVSLSTFS